MSFECSYLSDLVCVFSFVFDAAPEAKKLKAGRVLGTGARRKKRGLATNIAAANHRAARSMPSLDFLRAPSLICLPVVACPLLCVPRSSATTARPAPLLVAAPRPPCLSALHQPQCPHTVRRCLVPSDLANTPPAAAAPPRTVVHSTDESQWWHAAGDGWVARCGCADRRTTMRAAPMQTAAVAATAAAAAHCTPDKRTARRGVEAQQRRGAQWRPRRRAGNRTEEHTRRASVACGATTRQVHPRCAAHCSAMATAVCACVSLCV